MIKPIISLSVGTAITFIIAGLLILSIKLDREDKTNLENQNKELTEIMFEISKEFDYDKSLNSNTQFKKYMEVIVQDYNFSNIDYAYKAFENNLNEVTNDISKYIGGPTNESITLKTGDKYKTYKDNINKYIKESTNLDSFIKFNNKIITISCDSSNLNNAIKFNKLAKKENPSACKEVPITTFPKNWEKRCNKVTTLFTATMMRENETILRLEKLEELKNRL